MQPTETNEEKDIVSPVQVEEPKQQDSQTPVSKPKKSKKLLLILFAGVVLVGAGLAYYFVTKKEPVVQKKNQDTSNVLKTNPAKDNIATSQSRVDDSGFGDEDTLMKQLAEATNDQEKAEAYHKLYFLARDKNLEDTNKALGYIVQAEALQPTYGTALAIANIQEIAGNKIEALKYYKIYLTRAQAVSGVLQPGDSEKYQAIIDQLEQSI